MDHCLYQGIRFVLGDLSMPKACIGQPTRYVSEPMGLVPGVPAVLELGFQMARKVRNERI